MILNRHNFGHKTSFKEINRPIKLNFIKICSQFEDIDLFFIAFCLAQIGVTSSKIRLF